MRVGHQPRRGNGGDPATVSELEEVLSQWFEADVVLTSSGRSGLLLWLSAIGLSRYRSRIAIPRMISACVVEAVIQRGFPVDAAEHAGGADATIVYHQYGIPQSGDVRPAGDVVEDVCHAFFASESSGSRPFIGNAAVFSLPKFFGSATMCGGVATKDHRLAAEIRSIRDSSSSLTSERRLQQAEIFRVQGHSGGPDLPALYAERMIYPRIEDDELAGLPRTLRHLQAVGERRRQIADYYIDAFRSGFQQGWLEAVRGYLPFAFPLFGNREALTSIDAHLAEAGIGAGVYQIDVNRDMFQPKYESAILLPCHHEVSDRELELIVGVVKQVWFSRRKNR